MKDKFDLREYFSDREIIKLLCRKRAIAAKKCHDDHFLRNISSKALSPHHHIHKEIFTFFPARSKWIRLNKEERAFRDTNAMEINIIQLERTIWREIKKNKKSDNPKPEWLAKLGDFINEIQDLVLNEKSTYQIQSPRILPVLKDKNKNTYRPICLFELKDLVIIGQIAKYLTHLFDPLFSDSSYAFRAGIKTGKSFNHHAAIEDIIEFKNRMGFPLFVSECDIKKFYDCLNHTIIIEEFDHLVKELKGKFLSEIDNRSIYFFHSYLKAFSFNDNIHKVEKILLSKYGIHGGTIPWVKTEELSSVGSKVDSDKIGVPQGGAISCLIANIVLNHVDKRILSVSDANTCYVRFCDDMVLIHSDKAACDKILEVYQSALKEVKLISHLPIESDCYGKPFWNEEVKSKSTYKWDMVNKEDTTTHKNVPWLAFVGYQIRYDGLIRVRKRSIKKELKKQVTETDKIIKIVRLACSANVNKKAIKFRLQQRLISMAVGRFKYGGTKLSMCWCAGFKLLKSNSNITNQIRRLDRNREKQITRLVVNLKTITTPSRKSKKPKTPKKFYGANYSYNKKFV
jgi:hypothetical protein